MKLNELIENLEKCRNQCIAGDGESNPDVSICVNDSQGCGVVDIDKVINDEDFSKEYYINIYCTIK